MARALPSGFADSHLWGVENDHIVYLPQATTYKEVLKGGLPIEWFWQPVPLPNQLDEPVWQSARLSSPSLRTTLSSIPEEYFDYEPPSSSRTKPKKARSCASLPDKHPKKPKAQKPVKQIVAEDKPLKQLTICAHCGYWLSDESDACRCSTVGEQLLAECESCYYERLDNWTVKECDPMSAASVINRIQMKKPHNQKADCQACMKRLERLGRVEEMIWALEDNYYHGYLRPSYNLSDYMSDGGFKKLELIYQRM